MLLVNNFEISLFLKNHKKREMTLFSMLALFKIENLGSVVYPKAKQTNKQKNCTQIPEPYPLWTFSRFVIAF